MTWTQLAVTAKYGKGREGSNKMGWEIARCIGERMGRVGSAIREGERRMACDWSKMLASGKRGNGNLGCGDGEGRTREVNVLYNSMGRWR